MTNFLPVTNFFEDFFLCWWLIFTDEHSYRYFFHKREYLVFSNLKIPLLLSKMIFKKEALKFFGVGITPSSAIVGFHGWFCSFFNDCYFTISGYIICQQLSPCHCKMRLFALYSNHYLATPKTKIRWDTDHLNSM